MCADTRLTARINKINLSATLAITSKAKKLKSEGKDVVNFAAGEPDFDTPDHIKEAAIAAIKSGFTKYTPTTGTEELKKLIQEKFKRENSLDYALSQIVVSCGAKHSIFNALFVLVNKGEQVIIPSPYWVSYPEMVNLCEGKARFIKTKAKNNFKITPDELKKNITARTKLLILNSPSNPTGCAYSREELEKIAAVCVEKKVFVLSDEIYEKLLYDGLSHSSIASFGKDIYDLTITVNGLSKSHSMTGWRIGYLGAPADVAAAISKLQDHSTSNPSSISQKAAVAALASQGGNFCSEMRAEFQKRRDHALSRLAKMKKIGFIRPRGAFYIFCNISRTRMKAAAFAEALLDEALVALIPGESFGRDDYVRISFATGIDEITKGLDRIEGWIRKL